MSELSPKVSVVMSVYNEERYLRQQDYSLTTSKQSISQLIGEQFSLTEAGQQSRQLEKLIAVEKLRLQQHSVVIFNLSIQ